MHSGERQEFEEQLAVLCAGYNLPINDHRKHAYFIGLAKMSLAQFVRCVEFAITEEGPEELPTPRGIWRIHRELRRGPAINKAPEKAEPDHLKNYANRLLWLHISHRGGLGSSDGKASPELERILNFKRDLVSEFCGYIRDGDPMATPSAFVTWWLVGLQKISEVLPRTQIDLKRLAEEPDAQVPFAEVAGRELAPVQEAFA